MRDLIDRQATIEALGERPRFSTGGGYEMGVKEQYDRDLLAIINMPSAQPDSLVRSSARWMSVGHKRARICSHCFRDEPYKFADHDADIYDFCPHCGAKMEVNDERLD